jgi:NAD(P)-dependent dehydrogenase (short-subunit alcohol dehydrogenase family)
VLLRDKVVIVTGGAHGIGRALCERFAAEGARGVVVADIDAPAAAAVASAIGGLAVPTDVTSEASIEALVVRTRDEIGPIDLFCSNAGISHPGGTEVANADFERVFDVNYRSHLYAARNLVPKMTLRGDGYLLSTASAAGVLTQIGSLAYAVTKHAAVALAEWLSVTHGHQGLKVSVLCPQGVRTRLLLGERGERDSFLTTGAIEPSDVADAVIEGLEEERFLILPHPEVAEYMRRKASDYDRWLRGMRRLQARVRENPKTAMKRGSPIG